MTSTSSTSSSLNSNLKSFFLSKPISPSRLLLRQIYGRRRQSNSAGVLSVKAYMENPNSLSGFANKVIGSLPVVGLIARILSDEGGVGSDIIDFAEFRRRVGKKCTIMESKAFYEFQERKGKVMCLLIYVFILNYTLFTIFSFYS